MSDNGTNPFDIIRIIERNAIGMVLPCHRVVTFERKGGKEIIHDEVQPPKCGEFTILNIEELTDEVAIAINFARKAFEIYFPING